MRAMHYDQASQQRLMTTTASPASVTELHRTPYVARTGQVFEVAFSGFADATAWFLFAAMLIGLVASKSGLVRRHGQHFRQNDPRRRRLDQPARARAVRWRCPTPPFQRFVDRHRDWNKPQVRKFVQA
jgi:hypothetical protein